MKTIISDPHFQTLGQLASKWSVITHKGVVMTPAVEDSVLSLEISGTSGANWHGELRYSPFSVAAGDKLTVTFAARAKYPFTFSVWLGQQDSPHKSLVPDENHFGEAMMPLEWQRFSHSWTPCLSEDAARLNFVFGQIDNTVQIKDIALSQQTVAV